jgi:Zn-dependent protease/CBS domain-containing protein
MLCVAPQCMDIEVDMTKQAISLGRILGIPIKLDFSWFLIFALLTAILATSYYPFELYGVSSAVYWMLSAVTAVLFFASVLLHELGHSVVARRYKIPVRQITLFIFGGIAQISAEPPGPRAEFLIAIAGPIVSFVLAALCALLAASAGAIAPLFVVAKYLAIINGSLGLFNLIPGFPLDGGRVLRALVWRLTGSLHRATLIAGNIGRGVALLFMAFGAWQIINGDLGGLWIAFIGWFLFSVASDQVEEQTVHELLAKHAVSEAMSQNFELVPAGLTLQQLADQPARDNTPRAFVVQREGAVVGWLTARQMNAVPRAQWQAMTVAQAMVPLAPANVIQPNAELWSAAEEMARDDLNQLPVVENGETVGVLRREDVVRFIKRLQAVNA